MEDVRNLFFFVFSDRCSDHDIGTYRQPGRDGDKECHDLAICSNGSQGISIFKIAYNGCVGSVEELLEHAAESNGQGKKDQFAGQGTGEHIYGFFFFHQKHSFRYFILVKS